ncbi:MAG: hypothetical protein J0I82_01905, partial [Spirosoma sp.]|nr:hypothetical protein [Spirosoma sp.]
MAAPTLQTYRTSVLNGQALVLACYSDGSTQRLSELPPGVTIARKGGLIRLPYTPEAKGVYNPEQFGPDKYYDPNFRYILDWNPGGKSVAQRKRIGVNAFNHWTLTDQEKAALTYGEGILYLTESGLHGPMEGRGVYEAIYSDYENYIWNHIPTCGSGADPGVKLVVLNIEKSLGWGRGSYSDAEWNTKKTQSIFLESTGTTVTYDTLNTTSGLWASEALTRAQNRFVLLMEALKKKAAESITPKTDLEVVFGASMYQGEPRLDFVNNSGIFIEGSVNISHISGASGSTLTINGRTYTNISGSIWDHESSMQGYYYRMGKDFLEVDGKAIFEDKVPATQNYTYLWSKQLPRHIVADEKGYIQLNEKRMRDRQGRTRPIIRQIEPQYETDTTALIKPDGSYRVINARIPFADLQPGVTGDGEAPKVWQPPGDNYSRYCVIRLRAGAEKGWGLYLFPPGDVSKINLPIAQNLVFNHELHAITALDQARADMQRFERWWAGSTYVEDPEVQINGTGAFTAYSGTEAYAYSSGTFGTPKPAFMLRWKDEGTTWRVVFVGGMKQGFTDETTAVLRVPGGLLNGNRFSVKLIGPYAHVFEVVVQKADIGQTYEVLPIVNTDWLRPGYAARTANTSSGSGGDNGSSGGGTVAINKPSFDTFDYSPILTNPTWSEYDSRLHRGVPIGDKIVLDNGIIRVEIWKNFGGAPGHISASGQPNIINQNDWGRGTGMTIYRGGRTRQVEADGREIQAQWASAEGGGVGNNPIQIGDTFDNPAVVIQVGRSGNRVYTKSVMMNWAVRNEPTDV